jgi:hypothetical protein
MPWPVSRRPCSWPRSWLSFEYSDGAPVPKSCLRRPLLKSSGGLANGQSTAWRHGGLMELPKQLQGALQVVVPDGVFRQPASLATLLLSAFTRLRETAPGFAFAGETS